MDITGFFIFRQRCVTVHTPMGVILSKAKDPIFKPEILRTKALRCPTQFTEYFSSSDFRLD